MDHSLVLNNFRTEFQIRPYGRELGHEGRLFENVLQSPGEASPLSAASHSGVFCACVCEIKDTDDVLPVLRWPEFP